MPLIDVKCTGCEAVNEVYRALSDWPKTPPCPSCGKETEQAFFPKAVQWTVDPVVVFKAPDGSFRFPGDANGLSASRYEKQGYERVEIRGATEMRRFESRMDKIEYSKAARLAERKMASREAREKESRSILRDAMSRMTPYGRAVARAAMSMNDNKPRERATGAGFHSEAYSFDRSNRDESRDSQGRRRRD